MGSDKERPAFGITRADILRHENKAEGTNRDFAEQLVVEFGDKKENIEPFSQPKKVSIVGLFDRKN